MTSMQYAAEIFPTFDDELSTVLFRQSQQINTQSIDEIAGQILDLSAELESGITSINIHSILEAKRKLIALQVDFDLAHIALHIEADPTFDEVMRAEKLAMIDRKYEHVTIALAQCHSSLRELLSKAA